MTDEPTGGEAGPAEEPRYDYLANTAASYEMTPNPTTLVPETVHRRGGSGLIVSLAAVLGLVLAGGTFTAVQLLNGSTLDPAEAAPASTFAIVAIDLDPSAEQKLGVYRFSKRFPKSPTSKKGTSNGVVDTLLAEIVDSSDSPIDYKKDIKPWLGGSAAFAAYEGMDGEVKRIGILGFKDRAKATAALKKATADDGGGYAFLEHFVVIAETTADARAAANAAASQSLAGSNSHYADDVDALHGAPIITAWADVTKAFPALYEQFGGLLQGFGGFQGLSGAEQPSEACIAELDGLTPGSGKDPYAGLSAKCRAELFGQQQLTPAAPGPAPTLDPSLLPKGRFALGISVESEVAQLEAKGFGVASKSSKIKGSKDATRYLKSLPAGVTVGAAFGDLRPGITAFFNNLSKSPFGAELTKAVDQAETETGLSFPADINAVLGDGLLLAYDKQGNRVALRTHPDKVSKAESVLRQLTKLAAEGDDPFTYEVSGHDVLVSDDTDDAKRAFTGGGLTATPLFSKAVGDLPDAAQLIAFVNLEQLLQGFESETADHFRAVGVLVDGSSENTSVIIRVVVR